MQGGVNYEGGVAKFLFGQDGASELVLKRAQIPQINGWEGPPSAAIFPAPISLATCAPARTFQRMEHPDYNERLGGFPGSNIN